MSQLGGKTPELTNAGSTMLGYVVLKCSDRLLALSADHLESVFTCSYFGIANL